MTVTHDPDLRCEQFCTRPIGLDGSPGGDGWLAQCLDCTAAVDLICREILPSIRKHGYWSPPGATVEQELGHMQADEGKRERLRQALAGVLGEGFADVMFPDGGNAS